MSRLSVQNLFEQIVLRRKSVHLLRQCKGLDKQFYENVDEQKQTNESVGVQIYFFNRCVCHYYLAIVFFGEKETFDLHNENLYLVSHHSPY